MTEQDPISQDTLDDLALPNPELYYPSEEEQALTGFAPDIVEDMLKHLVLGMNLTDVANIVKLPPSRVHKWYNTNYGNFMYAVDYHKADNKRRLLHVLMKGERATAVRASQFMLERKFRDEYGKEIKIDVNNVMLENITRVVFDTAVRYIKDPEVLKLFVEDISTQIALIRPTEGLNDGSRLIT